MPTGKSISGSVTVALRASCEIVCGPVREDSSAGARAKNWDFEVCLASLPGPAREDMEKKSFVFSEPDRIRILSAKLPEYVCRIFVPNNLT